MEPGFNVTLDVKDSVFQGNIAGTNCVTPCNVGNTCGGAVHASNNTKLTIDHTVFTGNSVFGGGPRGSITESVRGERGGAGRDRGWQTVAEFPY